MATGFSRISALGSNLILWYLNAAFQKRRRVLQHFVPCLRFALLFPLQPAQVNEKFITACFDASRQLKKTLAVSDNSSTDPETIKNISWATSPDLNKNSSGANCKHTQAI